MQDGDLPRRYEPDWQSLSVAERESPFMQASFELLKEATHYTFIIASLEPVSPLKRNEAILRGHVVRLAKLMRLAVRELASRETFQQLSLTREVLDTIATFVYLAGDESGSRFDQYVKDSLVAERMMLTDIEANVEARSGERLPIEVRMRRSIEATAKAADVQDIDELPARRKIGFPNNEARVKLLGTAAYVAYRAGSGEVHGTWTDLYRNHLTLREDGNFAPNLSPFEVRPQAPLMIAELATSATGAHLLRLAGNSEIADAFTPLFSDLLGRIRRVDELHERLLSKSRT
jgi:hypothetical protein